MTTLKDKLICCNQNNWHEIINVIQHSSMQELKDCWNSIYNSTNKNWLWFAGAVRYEIELREIIGQQSSLEKDLFYIGVMQERSAKLKQAIKSF